MNKLKIFTITLSACAFASIITTGFASANPQQCQLLVNAGASKTPPGASFFQTFGNNINQCLASCNSMYGAGTDTATLQKISTCRSSLATLKFDKDYYKSLADKGVNSAGQMAMGSSIPSDTFSPAQNTQNNKMAKPVYTPPATAHRSSQNQMTPTQPQALAPNFGAASPMDTKGTTDTTNTINSTPTTQQKTTEKTPEIRWF